jgi:hypothetical protein
MGERGQEIPEDSLVLSYPRRVRRIAALDWFVVDDRGDFFLWWQINAGEEIVELSGTNSRKNLSTPERIVGLR